MYLILPQNFMQYNKKLAFLPGSVRSRAKHLKIKYNYFVDISNNMNIYLNYFVLGSKNVCVTTLATRLVFQSSYGTISAKTKI